MRVLVVDEHGPGIEYPCSVGDRVRSFLRKDLEVEYTAVCLASDLDKLSGPTRGFAVKALVSTGWSMSLADVGTKRVLSQATMFELVVLLGRRVQAAVLWSQMSESLVYLAGTNESRFLCLPYPGCRDNWYGWDTNRALVARFFRTALK